jgi:hypothetical protein
MWEWTLARRGEFENCRENQRIMQSRKRLSLDVICRPLRESHCSSSEVINGTCGQPLSPLVIYLNRRYGSEGWGFESLRARRMAYTGRSNGCRLNE